MTPLPYRCDSQGRILFFCEGCREEKTYGGYSRLDELQKGPEQAAALVAQMQEEIDQLRDEVGRLREELATHEVDTNQDARDLRAQAEGRPSRHASGCPLCGEGKS